MSVNKPEDGRSTLFGHAATQSWHPVQWLVRLSIPREPGGVIPVSLLRTILSWETMPVLESLSWALATAADAIRAEAEAMKVLLSIPPSADSLQEAVELDAFCSATGLFL